MFQTVRNAFKVRDIRNKMFFTLLMLIVIRLGSQIPIPGTDSTFFADFFASTAADFSFFNALTGGSFESFSILALGITPYITSSIIIQLLTIAIPKLEEMQREGEEGRKKMVTITRYVTVGLALLQSVAMSIGFGRQGLLVDFNAWSVIISVVAMTAGSAFIMWIGERITEKGVGNGISIVLVINIISRLPQDFNTLYTRFVKDAKGFATKGLAIIVVLAVIILMVVLVIILNDATRTIPVQYTQKTRGRQISGNNSSIPLKVNTAGVMPIIFASSIMQFPLIICSFAGVTGASNKVGAFLLGMLNGSNWCNPAQPQYTVGMLLYVVLLIFFAYFYTSITFNPQLVADNLRKSGGFIPGIRPGKPTQDYLERILNYIIFIGAVGLTVIGILPYIFSGLFSVNVSFGGTSLIIIVSVILETVKAIESQMLVRNYKGFLN